MFTLTDSGSVQATIPSAKRRTGLKTLSTLEMSSQASYNHPASPPAPHGGDMDPNEVRLRQNPTQHTSSSSANTTNSPNVNASVNAPHGGDMDPNEVRLRQARIQQLSGTSSPAANIPEPNNNLGSHGGVWMHQTQIQPAQYGSDSSVSAERAFWRVLYRSKSTPAFIPSSNPAATL